MTAVLKPFDFASDGYTVERLNVGDDRDFGDLTEGLAKAGLIEVTEPEVEPTADTKKSGK